MDISQMKHQKSMKYSARPIAMWLFQIWGGMRTATVWSYSQSLLNLLVAAVVMYCHANLAARTGVDTTVHKLNV